MKKKILFMMPYINCGGVETTLISLLNKLDSKNIDIDLLVMDKNGVFMNKIPKYVNINYLDIPKSEWGVFYGYKNSIKRLIKEIDFINLFKIFKNRRRRLTENRKENVEYFKYLDKVLPYFNKEYDLAIDYFGFTSFTTYYVANKIKSKKKISWIHSQFSLIQAQELNNYYEKYDGFYGVSKSSIKDFIEITRVSINKCKVFYNFIDVEKIKYMSNKEINDMNEGKIKICTVGRLEKVKGYDLAVKIARKLKENYIDFCWYFVGEGSLREPLEKYIKENHLEDNVVLLGLKSNPYPYIKNCDIYIQPSRYEGYCTTTNEARVLAKPIITTDVFGADEQFINMENGIITAFDVDEIYDAIVKIIKDDKLKEKFINKLEELTFNYDYQLDDLYRELN